MDFIKPINWGMKRFFPENMTVADNGLAVTMTEKLSVNLAEHFDDAIASALLNEMGAQGATAGIVLNKQAIFDAMDKQEPKKVAIVGGSSYLCPRCGLPVERPAGVGNEHYCVYCGQLVTWRRNDNQA